MSHKTILTGFAILVVPSALARAQSTSRMSVDIAGNQAAGISQYIGISRDASFVVFTSDTADLVPGDTICSVSSGGVEGNAPIHAPSVSNDGRWVAFASCLVRESLDTSNGDSDQPSTGAYVSGDGKWVAFASLATDLVPGDTNGIVDVFLRDRTNRTTVRCSYGSGGEGDGVSEAPSVSANGRFVAFASSATNLVLGDTNGTEDIFVFDRTSASVARVSVDSSGAQGDASSYPPPWGGPSISPDGRYVAFCSLASNLVLNDTNFTWDVFVHDRDLDNDGIYDEHVPGGVRTWRASVSTAGDQGNADSGRYGLWLSAFGRSVAFQSFAGNLIAVDLNGSDIFVHRNVGVVSTVLVSLDDTGSQAFGFHSLPSISADLTLAADARYVTWTSDSPVTASDQNAVDDVFLRDRTLNQTTMVSIGTGGIQADWGSSRSMVNASGSRIVFDSQASTFTPGDPTIAWDIFIRDPQAATTDVVSQPQGMGNSIWPTIDASGEIIAFSSDSVLVGGDGNNLSDVFVQDCDATAFVAFCAPGVDGIVTCPCGNPQVPAGSTKGCNNFAGGGTGGATLAATGTASLSADTLGFQLAGGVGSNVTVLFQGTGNSSNTRSGAGVRCVGGTLKRLYRGMQSAGNVAFPNDGVSVHDASAARGYTISAPSTLYYYCAYRNSGANGQPGCPGLTFGFNTTNAVAVPWSP